MAREPRAPTKVPLLNWTSTRLALGGTARPIGRLAAGVPAAGFFLVLPPATLALLARLGGCPRVPGMPARGSSGQPCA